MSKEKKIMCSYPPKKREKIMCSYPLKKKIEKIIY
jgi:hypothetical protein